MALSKQQKSLMKLRELAKTRTGARIMKLSQEAGIDVEQLMAHAEQPMTEADLRLVKRRPGSMAP